MQGVPTPTKRTCSAISKWTSSGHWDIHTTRTPAVQFQNIFLTPQLCGFGVTLLLFEEIEPTRLLRADGSVAALGSLEAACLAGRGFCPSSSQGRGVVRAGTGGGGRRGRCSRGLGRSVLLHRVRTGSFCLKSWKHSLRAFAAIRRRRPVCRPWSDWLAWLLAPEGLQAVGPQCSDGEGSGQSRLRGLPCCYLAGRSLSRGALDTVGASGLQSRVPLALTGPLPELPVCPWLHMWLLPPSSSVLAPLPGLDR